MLWEGNVIFFLHCYWEGGGTIVEHLGKCQWLLLSYLICLAVGSGT